MGLTQMSVLQLIVHIFLYDKEHLFYFNLRLLLVMETLAMEI